MITPDELKRRFNGVLCKNLRTRAKYQRRMMEVSYRITTILAAANRWLEVGERKGVREMPELQRIASKVEAAQRYLQEAAILLDGVPDEVCDPKHSSSGALVMPKVGETCEVREVHRVKYMGVLTPSQMRRLRVVSREDDTFVVAVDTLELPLPSSHITVVKK